MNRAKSRPIAICLTLIASAWLVAASDADPKSKAANAALGTAPTGVVVVTTALQPFTHIAYIPARRPIFHSVRKRQGGQGPDSQGLNRRPALLRGRLSGTGRFS